MKITENKTNYYKNNVHNIENQYEKNIDGSTKQILNTKHYINLTAFKYDKIEFNMINLSKKAKKLSTRKAALYRKQDETLNFIVSFFAS